MAHQDLTADDLICYLLQRCIDLESEVRELKKVKQAASLPSVSPFKHYGPLSPHLYNPNCKHTGVNGDVCAICFVRINE